MYLSQLKTKYASRIILKCIILISDHFQSVKYLISNGFITQSLFKKEMKIVQYQPNTREKKKITDCFSSLFNTALPLFFCSRTII